MAEIRILQEPIEVRVVYASTYGVFGRQARNVEVTLHGPFTPEQFQGTFEYNEEAVSELNKRGIKWEFV